MTARVDTAELRALATCTTTATTFALATEDAALLDAAAAEIDARVWAKTWPWQVFAADAGTEASAALCIVPRRRA